MSLKHGAQTVDTYAGKRIIKSGAVGATNVEEIKWLIRTLTSSSAAWKHSGWGYICDISKMSPVSPDASEELVNLHKALATSGCKAMAFLDFCSFVTGTQAKDHEKKAKTGIAEGHFKDEQEAIKWIEGIINK